MISDRIPGPDWYRCPLGALAEIRGRDLARGETAAAPEHAGGAGEAALAGPVALVEAGRALVPGLDAAAAKAAVRQVTVPAHAVCAPAVPRPRGHATGRRNPSQDSPPAADIAQPARPSQWPDQTEGVRRG